MPATQTDLTAVIPAHNNLTNLTTGKGSGLDLDLLGITLQAPRLNSLAAP